jgi:hypothetical protein
LHRSLLSLPYGRVADDAKRAVIRMAGPLCRIDCACSPLGWEAAVYRMIARSETLFVFNLCGR